MNDIDLDVSIKANGRSPQTVGSKRSRAYGGAPMRSTGPRSDRQTKGEGRLWLALSDLLDSPPLGSSPPRGRGNFRPVKRQLKGRLALMNEPTTLPSEGTVKLM